MQEEQTAIKPREGWAHVGCADCGHVDLWPASRSEWPICTHTGRVVWGIEDESDRWTLMVPVRVEVLGPDAS